MTDIEQKALALLNEVVVEGGGSPVDIFALQDDVVSIALYRAIEQREAAEQELNDYREKVSSKVGRYVCNPTANSYDDLRSLIIPAPKPDPLVEALHDCGVDRFESWADQLRAALEARGLEIREKNDD